MLILIYPRLTLFRTGALPEDERTTIMPLTKIAMSTAEFDRLRKIIYERSGIHFQDSKKYVLESRLGHRLQELKMDSFDEYVKFLSIGPYQNDEFQEMFNRITINETSFFRNEPQLEVFESDILPRLLKARESQKRLRIWSAACSTGEEPYTLAILVQRTLGVRLPDWKIEILGTDISDKALKVAMSGKYTKYSIRNTSPLDLKRYFTQEGEYHTIHDDIKSMVVFENLNLHESHKAQRHGRWDVIFCRNVMIYFDDEMKQRCVATFGKVLEDDGFLFIGHSESLRGMKTELQSIAIPRAFCYSKDCFS